MGKMKKLGEKNAEIGEKKCGNCVKNAENGQNYAEITEPRNFFPLCLSEPPREDVDNQAPRRGGGSPTQIIRACT